jgi:hypothetical protein
MELIFYFETSQNFYWNNKLLIVEDVTFEVMKLEHSARISAHSLCYVLLIFSFWILTSDAVL